MIPDWQTGIVKKIEQATPNTRRYWIELPAVERFDFIPGQFVTLDLPIHEKRNKRWRSYSIASAPDGTNIIELVIVNLEGGAGTNYLFNEVQTGSELTLRGPQGVFVLPEQMPANVFLICTGTGIAPFRSMVRHIHSNKLPHGNIHIIFGTRTQKDLLYEEELWALEQEMSTFRFHPTLSREHWPGQTGYVHQVYEQLCADKPEALFMLCGWKDMVNEAKRRILDMGYVKKDIHLELY